MITKQVTVEQDVKNVLLGTDASWSEEAGKVVLRLTAQLDRKLYVKVNKILEILGGKWNRSTKGHIFVTDPRPQMEQVEAGAVESELWDFFETPADVADRMAELAEIEPRMQVLEPSAGEGRLIRAILKAQPLSALVWYELNEGRVEHLLAQDYGYGYRADFLDTWRKADRIVMNPPWSKGQDRKHLLHAWDCLNEGGILVAAVTVMTAYHPGNEVLALYQNDHAILRHREELPPGTFEGTGACGAIIKIEKWNNPLRLRQGGVMVEPQPVQGVLL